MKKSFNRGLVTLSVVAITLAGKVIGPDVASALDNKIGSVVIEEVEDPVVVETKDGTKITIDSKDERVIAKVKKAIEESYDEDVEEEGTSVYVEEEYPRLVKVEDKVREFTSIDVVEHIIKDKIDNMKDPIYVEDRMPERVPIEDISREIITEGEFAYKNKLKEREEIKKKVIAKQEEIARKKEEERKRKEEERKRREAEEAERQRVLAEKRRRSQNNHVASATRGQSRNMGTFNASAYTLRASCQGQWGDKVASGKIRLSGLSRTEAKCVAVDPRVIPLGSLLRITVPGMPHYNGEYIAYDTGGAIKGNKIDIFVGGTSDEVYAEARSFGRRDIQVEIIGRAW